MIEMRKARPSKSARLRAMYEVVCELNEEIHDMDFIGLIDDELSGGFTSGQASGLGHAAGAVMDELEGYLRDLLEEYD
jgi:hypothetical protein